MSFRIKFLFLVSMKKQVSLLILCFILPFYLTYSQSNTDCWTLVNKGADIYNGQYNNGEFPGYHDPETTDLEEVSGGFLTTGQYNKQTFDSNDNNIYTNLVDKDGSYLTKHDYSGNLKWIVYTEKSINSYRDVMFGSVEDNDGNIYVIGHSVGGTFFDSNGTQTTFTNTDNFSSGFIVKLNGNGELLWHITIDNVFSKKINIDEDGNILLSGDISIYNNFKFNFYLNGIITDNLSNFEIMGNNSNYVNRGILKISPEGELLWYTSIKTSGPNSEFLIDIGSDKNNNIYVTGYCSSTAEIYSAGDTNNPNIINWSSYPTKTFLIKFDKEGQFLWKVKSLLDDPVNNGVLAWSTTVDDEGNSYITGSNDSRGNNSPNQVFENNDGSITSEHVGTFFIAKVNTNGICEWIKGAAHSYSGTGYKVIKSNDEVIVVGSVRGFGTLTEDVEFLSTDGNNIRASINVSDYFLAVYDTDGNVDRIVSNGINNQSFFYSDRISGFFKDSNDNYYISRNLGFFINGPQNYENFGHIINAQDLNGRDGTITKFNEGCGLIIGNVINENMPSLSFCDNTSVGTDTDGLIEFDLTQNEVHILINEPLSDYQISYYTDENLTNLISSPQDYQNTNHTETIYIKVEHLSDSNKSGQTSFIISVNELPTIATLVSLQQCDDNTDGFSAFNLTEVASEIITDPTNYTITYHESITDANAGLSTIINTTAYINEIVSNDRVWARVENSNGCYRVSEVNLVVSTTQIPNTVSLSYYECDNGANTTDGIATFDFSAAESSIRNIFPTNQQLIISYYQSEVEALAETNAITDISNYQNTNSPNQQTIYVRVDSALDNDCLGLGGHINLFVDTVPVANPVTIAPECDNDRDGLFAFDTSSIQNTIVGSQTNVSVSYVDENGTTLSSPLPNPFITGSQTITARITNTNAQDPNGQCYDETQIVFTVNNVPIAHPVNVQEACDDDFDGIVDFDTSTIESTLLGAQTGMVVRYFDQNNLELPSPLPNPFNTASQDIRVRIENPQYAICYEETTISFVVREKPNFELAQDEIICMTSTPSQTLRIQNPTGSFTYTWRDSNNNVISNNSDVMVISGGVYSVFATSTFGCDSEVKSITVTESSIAQITRSDIEVIDDSNSNSIRVTGTNLGLGDYEFQLLDENSMTVVDYQSSPNFTNLEGGVYTLNIRDRNGCGEISFEVSLLSFPPFFTPNNDGINDTWQIKGVTNTFYSEGSIMIFNRYGKRVGVFTINDNGWNGLYGGQQLPPNDYWFHAKLVGTNGTVRVRKGNFSLLR